MIVVPLSLCKVPTMHDRAPNIKRANMSLHCRIWEALLNKTMDTRP